MSGWPESLKPIGKFMARAREIESVQPVVAYYCNYYSLKKAIELRDPSDVSANRFVTGLLEKCETTKATLPPDENDSHRAVVVEFALSVFERADGEDRAERATKDTALTFYAAMCFLEVCSVFGPLGHELEERLRYAKWKAADITKALKEGRKPLPGAPGEAEARAKAERERQEAEESQTQQRQSFEKEPVVGSENPNGVPPAPPVSEYDTPTEPLYPQYPNHSEYPPVAPKYPSSDAPSPLQTPPVSSIPTPALDINATAPAVPALDVSAPPTTSAPTPHVPLMQLPTNDQPAAAAFSSPSFYESMKQVESALPSPETHTSSVQPQPESTNVSPPPAAKPAPAPAPAPAPIPAPTPARAPVVAPTPPIAAQRSVAVNPNYRPSIKQTQEAQRLAKYAASALDFQDIKTAINNMQRALGLLQGTVQ